MGEGMGKGVEENRGDEGAARTYARCETAVVIFWKKKM